MFDSSVAAALTRRGQWDALLAFLRQHAATEPEAAHSLGALMHGASGSAAVATDFVASAEHYCRCVRRILELSQQPRGVRPAVAYPVVFGDAVHAIGSALEYEEVKPGDPVYAECEAVLRSVARECGRSELLTRPGTAAGDAEAAINAHFSLGVAAAQRGDRDAAAQRYRQAMHVFEQSGGAAVNTGRNVRSTVDGAANNLRVLEAATPEEHAQAMAVQRASLAAADPEHVDQRLSSRVVEPRAVARPACAGCGATPLALKRCCGSCGGAGAEGKFCSDACFRASWKEHKKRTGCRNVAAAEAANRSAPAANTAPAASAAPAARPAAANAAGAAPGATRSFIYQASIEDGHGHEAKFEVAIDVDAAILAAASDLPTLRQLMRQIAAETKAPILALRPWRCFGCGGAPTHLLNTMSVFLNPPPPMPPVVYDIVQPYCKAKGGACEAACRSHVAQLHAELKQAMPDFPEHTEV